jgi:hypothetical protein
LSLNKLIADVLLGASHRADIMQGNLLPSPSEHVPVDGIKTGIHFATSKPAIKRSFARI